MYINTISCIYRVYCVSCISTCLDRDMAILDARPALGGGKFSSRKRPKVATNLHLPRLRAFSTKFAHGRDGRTPNSGLNGHVAAHFDAPRPNYGHVRWRTNHIGAKNFKRKWAIHRDFHCPLLLDMSIPLPMPISQGHPERHALKLRRLPQETATQRGVSTPSTYPQPQGPHQKRGNPYPQLKGPCQKHGVRIPNSRGQTKSAGVRIPNSRGHAKSMGVWKCESPLPQR